MTMNGGREPKTLSRQRLGRRKGSRAKAPSVSRWRCGKHTKTSTSTEFFVARDPFGAFWKLQIRTIYPAKRSRSPMVRLQCSSNEVEWKACSRQDCRRNDARQVAVFRDGLHGSKGATASLLRENADPTLVAEDLGRTTPSLRACLAAINLKHTHTHTGSPTFDALEACRGPPCPAGSVPPRSLGGAATRVCKSRWTEPQQPFPTRAWHSAHGKVKEAEVLSQTPPESPSRTITEVGLVCPRLATRGTRPPIRILSFLGYS
jgi:hypothetical protein